MGLPWTHFTHRAIGEHPGTMHRLRLSVRAPATPWNEGGSCKSRPTFVQPSRGEALFASGGLCNSLEFRIRPRQSPQA